MAVSKIKPKEVAVSMYKSATLTANNTNANNVDFSTEISQHCPDGLTFKRLEFVGAWPGQTWNNAIVVRCNRHGLSATNLELATMGTQSYNIYAVAIYG